MDLLFKYAFFYNKIHYEVQYTDAVLYVVANIFSFCLCVFVCVHVPFFSIMLISVLLLFFPSSLISPCKTFHHFHYLFLFSFFFLTFSHQLTVIPLKMLEIHLMSNTPFANCSSEGGVCGTKWLLIQSSVDQRDHLNLCLKICLCMGCVASL